MSIHVYSIWTHQLENGDYYSYCPQFPVYYSIALTSFDAVVRLSDVILSLLNNLIEKEIELPPSEYFDYIPDELLSGLQSPQVYLMPIRIEDGVQNKSPFILQELVEENDLIVLPLEILELPETVEGHFSTNPELIGFNLPVLELLQCDILRKEIEKITTSYNPDYIVGSVVSGNDEIGSFLKHFCENVLEKLHAIIHEYSMISLLTYFIPQYDLLHYFYARENNELERKATVQQFGGLHKEYFAAKRANRSVHSLGLRFLIDYIAAERPSGINKSLDPDTYDRLLALGFLYVHSREVADRHYQIKCTESLDILPQGFHEIETGFSDDWFHQYSVASVDNGIEIIEENTYPPSHLEMNEDDSKRLNKKLKKYITTKDDYDKALMAEFGVTMHDLRTFDRLLAGVLTVSETEPNKFFSCCSISRERLISGYLEHTDLSRETVEHLLQIFTLPIRDGWQQIPDGYTEDDNDPDNPFAELSIYRRPLIQIEDDTLMWGWRYRSISYIIFSKRLEKGNLPCKTYEMQAFNSKVTNYHSTIFRESVYLWFRENYSEPQFHVEEDEVKLTKLYKDAGDLGDIDVAVCDMENNILYSIECKHNTHPRKTKEMRNEFDKFGVIGGKNDYLFKHKRRHDNLKSKPEIIKERLKFKENPKIISLHITEDITMVQHTRAAETPIFSYKDLIRKKHAILREAAEHPFNKK